jgi:hypothetical protein
MNFWAKRAQERIIIEKKSAAGFDQLYNKIHIIFIELVRKFQKSGLYCIQL